MFSFCEFDFLVLFLALSNLGYFSTVITTRSRENSHQKWEKRFKRFYVE